MQFDFSSPFLSFDLTDEEKILGSRLSVEQVAVLSNLRADAIMRKLGLTFDPNSPDKFIQDEAYHRGQIDILNYILEVNASFRQTQSE